MRSGIIASGGGQLVGLGLRGRRALAPAPASGWAPSALSAALLAWWSADDVASLTLAGANVTTWADKVGGLALTQAISSAKPVWAANGFGAAPGVTFDGADDHLRLASVPAALQGSGETWIWALAQQTFLGTMTSSVVLFAYGSSVNNGFRRVSRASVSNVSRLVVTDNTTTVRLVDTSVDFSGKHVVGGRFYAAGAATAGRIDGADTNPSTGAGAANTGAGNVTLGANTASTAAGFWQGAVREVLITGALSAGQQASLETYLQSRIN